MVIWRGEKGIAICAKDKSTFKSSLIDDNPARKDKSAVNLALISI